MDDKFFEDLKKTLIEALAGAGSGGSSDGDSDGDAGPAGEDITKALGMTGESDLVKSVTGLKDSVDTIMKALVGEEDNANHIGILDRMARLESGTAVSKALDGQDSDGDGDGNGKPVVKVKPKAVFGKAMAGLLTNGRVTLE